MNSILSFTGLVLKTNIVVQFVIVSLIIMSVYIWMIYFISNKKIKSDAKKIDTFEKVFWSGIMLEDFYQERRKRLNYSIGRVFSSAMTEWIISQKNQNLNQYYIKDALRGRIDILMNQTIEKIESEFLSDISPVATIASLSPFFGLFGTVWGVMDTFRSIANSATVTLNIIAPGIAEALITTAIGIFVAICSVFIYNSINSKISHCSQKLQSFKADMFSILSRELDYSKTGKSE